MEVGLEGNSSNLDSNPYRSLNPCFNGSWSRSDLDYARNGAGMVVLILVLMEVGHAYEPVARNTRQL